ncbi:septation protein A [Tepidicaulis sp. LMO-SS28]|uniref:septation protein A n=1 Tax=Tepidicaulis sp. LMO-SS28 TaxID=3447455 RepID=UPI003EDEBEC8
MSTETSTEERTRAQSASTEAESGIPAEAALAQKSGMTGSQWLRMGLEVGPLVVFFLINAQAANWFGVPDKQSIFYATGAFMVATAVSLSLSYILYRKVPMMPLITGAFVLVFGGLTLWLQDEQFIKLKPTLTNLLFAAGLLGGLAFGKASMKYLFDGAFRLTETGWRILTLRWGLFFVFLAILNEIIWRNFTTDFWVSFKVFGIMPITMVFALAQLSVVSKHQLGEERKES